MQWLIDPARETHAGVILAVGSAWLSNMSDPGGKCGLQDGCITFFVDASRKPRWMLQNLQIAPIILPFTCEMSDPDSACAHITAGLQSIAAVCLHSVCITESVSNDFPMLPMLCVCAQSACERQETPLFAATAHQQKDSSTSQHSTRGSCSLRPVYFPLEPANLTNGPARF